MSTPPPLARWILERALPADVRDDVGGDLLEMYERRVRTDGAAGARRWYWRQAFSFLRRFGAERLRERRQGIDMTTGFSLLDIRLALRMLARYPGLAAVSVAGMAVAITIATVAFTIVRGFLNPSLPLPNGDRIVALQNWDVSTNNAERRAMRDFARWRTGLRSVEDIGAFRSITRNLIADGSQPEMISIAEMTASGFRIAGVPARLGRTIVDADERPEAPPVVVIGADVWQRRFGGDPSIVGREIQLGANRHTIVGVMPPGFAFPLDHSYWIPWRIDHPEQYAWRSGPGLNVFARLRDGVALETADAELAALGHRVSEESPATHQHLRPRVLPYAFPFTDMDDPDGALVMRVIQTAVVTLLLIVCVNVAILVYARTASRQGEIAVRTALGASRRRIIGQLFIEALVLAVIAAGIGAVLVSIALTRLDAAFIAVGGRLPFWISLRLSWPDVIYLAGLTLLAGVVIGVVPALKATGTRVQSGLHGLSAGGGARMQMGRLWTALIVAQVAVAVWLLPAAVVHATNALTFRTGDPGFAISQFLSAELVLDRNDNAAREEATAFRARYGLRQMELERMLESEGAVQGVTYSLTQPGSELAAVLEVEGLAAPDQAVDYNIVSGSRTGHLVRFNRIAPDFFVAFDVPMLMGRPLDHPDAAPHAPAVVVNREFVDRLLGGGNPLGRRVRYVGVSREAGRGNIAVDRWHDIVGVVETFPAATGDGSVPRLYHAAEPGDFHPAQLSVRVRAGQPSSFANRLRQLAAQVDPTLQLRGLSSTDETLRREQGLMRIVGVALAAIMLSVLVLSAAGIHALMSFTVARRRKEIGIRTALGADPRRLLGDIFSRAFLQLGAGAALGMIGAFSLDQLSNGDLMEGNSAWVLPAVAVFMTAVGLLAAAGPARRGLRIDPTEALREE